MSRHLDPIIAIICEQAGISGEHLDEDSHLFDDCGIDSLDAVEISFAIEDEFDVVVADETLESWRTIGDICEFIEGVHVGESVYDEAKEKESRENA